jgi:hypothetical protein
MDHLMWSRIRSRYRKKDWLHNNWPCSLFPNGGQSIENAVTDEDTTHHVYSVCAGHKSLNKQICTVSSNNKESAHQKCHMTLFIILVNGAVSRDFDYSSLNQTNLARETDSRVETITNIFLRILGSMYLWHLRYSKIPVNKYRYLGKFRIIIS